MKKINWAVLALSVMSLLIFSCKNNGTYYTYQTVPPRIIGDILSSDGNTMRILLDDRDTVLIINSADIDRDELTDRTYHRIVANVKFTSSRKNGDYRFYEARNISMDSLLTKLPVFQSYLETDEGNELDEEIGNDYIHIYDAQIAAKYLTISYGINHGRNGIAHFLNLVIDDTIKPIVDANGVIEIQAELKHNDFGDLNIYPGYGLVSFDISDYMKMEGVKEIKMNVAHSVSNSNVSTKIVIWENDKPTPEPLESKINKDMSLYKMAR